MKILYITGMLPDRLENGTEIATNIVARALRALGHDVLLAGYLRPPGRPPRPGEVVLGTIPIETARASVANKLYWSIDALVRGEPLSVTKFRVPSAASILLEMAPQLFDVVLFDKPQMYWLFKDLDLATRKLVIWHAVESDTYDGVKRQSTGVSKVVYFRESTLCRRMELSVLLESDALICLTEADLFKLRGMGFEGHATVLPLITSIEVGSPVLGSEFTYDVGILGNWMWTANRTGLEWFLREVLPLLPTNFSIGVAGLGAEAALWNPDRRLTWLGFVDSASAFLNSCRVVVIPLTGGTGISMKVVEAASYGLPCVTTLIGARGLERLPTNIATADDTLRFADLIVQMAGASKAQRDAWATEAKDWLAERTQTFGDALESAFPCA